jgi:hypothetical protein
VQVTRGHPRRRRHRRSPQPPRPGTTSSAPRPPAAVGIADRYQVGERQLTFIEPPHDGPAAQRLGQRTLAATIWYPLAGSHPAAGPLPLLMFAPDLVNQPRDLTYALTSLLALSAWPHDLFSGLLDRYEIGAAGQSDGGDTVAALAANGCCTDPRLTAVTVLSGAEWPPMPGRYFPRGSATPPMLIVQGSADTINPPWTSVQLYHADSAGARYYLDLLGADHMTPYTGAGPVEQLVARVTLAFFNRYLLGQAGALAAMTRAGNVSGTAVLASGGQPPP